MPSPEEEETNWEEELLNNIPVATPTPEPASAAPTPTPARARPAIFDDDDAEDPASYLSSSGLQTQTQVDANNRNLFKPWMQFHKFTLVKTVDEVKKIVDEALLHGRCALDLETEGFDNRIDYDADGKPSTKHKIVGFCIGLKGAGYYIPVRHSFDRTYGQADPNVPVQGVEAEIRRLCLASQPILTEEGLAEDPYASMKWEVPPRIILYFWNALFDQEFLYPITGIDFWHPASFEDGMLAAYTTYTDDAIGLKAKAFEKLSIADPDVKDGEGKPVVYNYEMIEFEELFPPNIKRADRKIADVYPEEGSDIVRYGCSDGICTELLCETKKVQWEFAKEPASYTYKEVVSDPTKKHSFTYKLERQTAQAVRVLERSRAKIDKDELKLLLDEAQNELESYEEKIKKIAASKGFHGFNPGSPEQLSTFLFEKQGLDINPKPKKNEASGQYKTDAATLEQMYEANPDIEVLDWVVKYRQIDKIIGTYLTNLIANCDENECLRFKFLQTGAATGRFTAPSGEVEHGFSGIPIQGIPARSDPKKPKVAHSLRRMFVARPGYTLVKIDYAGQELRIVTNLSREPLWLNEFKAAAAQGKEADLHTLTAQAFFGPHITKANKVERNMGKIANFSLIYGGGVQAIQRATKCDKVEASRRKANFDKSVPTFAKWVAKQHADVKRDLGVSTAFQRFIAIPDANIKPGQVIRGQAIDEQEARRIRAGCERKSTNYPIQGSGADILKISLVKLAKDLGRRGWLRNGGDDSVRMIMTVHDEIVFEIRHERLTTALPEIIRIMESPSALCHWEIPLVVEPLIGLNWEAKYDWLEIMHGEAPVPDWLVDFVKPGVDVAVHTPEPSAPAATAPAQTPTASPAPSKSAKPSSLTPSVKAAKVATFLLPKDFLTRESIRLVMMAISGSVPIGDQPREGVVRLQVKDQQGNVLIDPKLGIHVFPERFSRELHDRNLGGNGWEIEENT